MILKSNCCDARIVEVISPAIVHYGVEIEETGRLNHTMFPTIDGDVFGYQCAECLDFFTNKSGDNITDVPELVEFLKGKQ
jgi:hypothetical protein